MIKLIKKQVLHALVFVAVFRNVFRVGMNFVNTSLHNYFEYRVFGTSTLKLSLWRNYCQKRPCCLAAFMEQNFNREYHLSVYCHHLETKVSSFLLFNTLMFKGFKKCELDSQKISWLKHDRFFRPFFRSFNCKIFRNT